MLELVGSSLTRSLLTYALGPLELAPRPSAIISDFDSTKLASPETD